MHHLILDGVRIFGLRNHSVQNNVVHHEFIPQIWWDALACFHSLSTKQFSPHGRIVPALANPSEESESEQGTNGSG
jgi:hypothetical protein